MLSFNMLLPNLIPLIDVTFSTPTLFSTITACRAIIRPKRRFISEVSMKFWVLLSAAFLTFAAAQNRVKPSSPEPKQVDQELKVTLSIDQTHEPTDSAVLQACLVHYPPIACQPLTLTVKNDGPDVVLIWGGTCSSAFFGGVSFDFRHPNGKWEPFPSDDLMHICTRSTIDGRKLSPGESYVERATLSQYTLHKDSSYPPFDDEHIHPRHPGYEFLIADEHVIRAHWGANACIASDKLKADSVPFWFGLISYCTGTRPTQNGVVLVSNPLILPAGL
jgi:hypothetical protein